MPNVPNTSQDSYSPLLLEVIMAADGGKNTIQLQRDYFESLNITLSNEGAWTGRLVLFDRTGDFLLQVITAAGNDRRILIRWGWDDGRGIEVLPQYVANWTIFRPEFTPQGTRLEFDLVCAHAYEQALDKKVRSFPANTRVSDIIEQIAAERGWRNRDRLGRPTIEPTETKLTEPLVQRGESDFEFIIKRLLKRAVNEGKQGNYRFHFDNDNIVYFHTEEFTRGAPQEVATYTFAQDIDGDVISFVPADLKFFSSILGEGQSVYWGVDSLTGARLRMASTDIGGLGGNEEKVDAEASFLTRVFTKELRAVKDTLVTIFRPIIARDEVDFERKVRARFDKLRRQPYTASLDVRGTHAAQPTNRVRVNYFTSDSQVPHFLSGTFFVKTVEHEISSGGWLTHFELYRVGVQKTDDTDEIQAAIKQTAQTTPATQGAGIDSPLSRASKTAKERRTVQ